MAFNDNQTEAGLPAGSSNKRTSIDFLPKYFRTNANQKFLSATIDQMISEGTVDKINAFIGRQDTPAYKSTDRYLEEISNSRQSYQLEPSIVSKDKLDNVTFFKDYNDYINQLKFFSGQEVNHSNANSEEYYAWNPHIDWDKFVNYREYYWLPSGPQPIAILGQSRSISSTYTVKLVNEVDNVAYLFTPDGLTRNPPLKLYRGQTYRFEIDCKGQPIALKSVRVSGDAQIYTKGVTLFDENGKQLVDENLNNIANVFTEKGVIEIKVPDDAPNILYYVSKNDINASGFFSIYNIDENTEINVDAEIIGKKTYRTNSNVELSNGMKIYFQGKVTPEKYATGHWYVEGVGTAINLVKESDLDTPAAYTADQEVEFDNENFDTQGFDVNNNFPGKKDYITINRASMDRNPWSRHNRWFHRSVIETSASANNQIASVDQVARAKRPIIEFEPNLQLWNFGKVSKKNVNVVDDFTTDVFSTIEGALGYNVDEIDLVEGMRVLFTADPDVRVNGRIFKVSFITHLGVRRITLLTDDDTEPQEGETVLVTEGTRNRGRMFHYKNSAWSASQEKVSLNQSPLFDVVDSSSTSYGNTSKYPGSTFAGTKLFSYKPGTVYDTELLFNIAYRNVGNFGDIVFDFNLHTESFSYQDVTNVNTVKLENGYLSVTESLTAHRHTNGWITAANTSKQMVVRQYNVSNVTNYFPIDVYDKSGTLTDLVTKVYVNGDKKTDVDYTVYVQNEVAYIQFFGDLTVGDAVVIKTYSSANKNNNGFYEFPFNLENNPQNLSVDEFTLGEINNHVVSIADKIPGFKDTIPGRTSLRDYGNISSLGSKIVQHSAPIALISYHLTNKTFNVIKSLRYAKNEYSKFKRKLIRIASDYGYDGITRNHLDLVLREATKDNAKTMPYYLSDMVPFGANFVYDQEVIDDSITEYPLIFDFNLTTASEKAVLVYLNEEILLYGKDYEFVNTNFVRILAPITAGDNLKIVQYDATDGCYIPPTPSKLGIYPLYEPAIYVDNTYQTPTKVIQGHDGSITVAFNDYRDDLLLEFEKRIFNNVKVRYDSNLFDIYDFVSGYSRSADVSTAELNLVIVQEFLSWTSLISSDYTKHTFFDDVGYNPFTFNYKEFSTLNGKKLPGFWRGIFKDFFDTDRPHTHPWEMLGLGVEPLWWQDTYGPAPYTSDNLLLWKDLSEGIIRDPSVPLTRDERFARPFLLDHLPVDESGNLRSPLAAGLVTDYVSTRTKKEFTFGDQAPIESAWRRSSEYPFALITALTLLRPAKVFATCFDRVRQFRDDTGQIVYKLENGNLRFNLKNLVYPNTANDSQRSFTSGLINYVVDHIIAIQSIDAVDTYKTELSNVEVKIASKLGGFTSKEKFKLILDSRSPLNKGNVFVPEENYKIILNTSSPIDSINYSAVIVEKQATGFIIKGYNKITPLFKYFKPIETVGDPVVNIGGISESFVDWIAGKYYHKDQIVRYSDSYYRTTIAHTSSTNFETKYFVRLPSLPLSGGRNIVIRRKFETTASTLHYGAELATVQEVVDFLLGYGEYLVSAGFNFDFYNSELRTVTDFQTACREFAFWTTQNWAAGAVISLSPAADELKFQRDYVVVDNIYDSFYDYSVYKQDGNSLEPLFTNSVRQGNSYALRLRNTADGIYHATLNLVQKEHVVILDDITIFNDVIYDQVQGYRQERIKVVGYRTDGWQGDFDIPGFVYDKAFVSEWKPWKDFNLGDTVKHKEFYYSARTNVPGTQEFNYNDWYLLESRPEPRLLPNWEYRANEFADFYDLDSNSFDTDQQQFAQHLIGYQNRQYLENIINDDIAQYKFYQGMIQEKGTKNSLLKLFDALSTVDEDSLEFFEEWAVRLGQYGASAGFEEVEYRLDESKFLINPQPFELVKAIDPVVNDFVYRVIPDEVYLKPENYTHAPFPTKNLEEFYTLTAGYAREEDVNYRVTDKTGLISVNINALREGDYFWVGYDKNSWNIYRFTLFSNRVQSLALSNGVMRITLVNNIDGDIEVGDYIGINNSIALLEGFYTIINKGFNFIDMIAPEGLTQPIIDVLDLTLNLYKFVSVRRTTINNINDIGIPKKRPGDLVWLDGENNNWSVWKYENSYQVESLSTLERSFGKAVAVNDESTALVVSTANKVVYYTRPTVKMPWVYKDQIVVLSTQNSLDPNTSLLNVSGSFGDVLSLSADGTYLAIGAPKTATLSATDSVNDGYVSVYTKNTNGYYIFTKAILSTDFTTNTQSPISGEFFGSQVSFFGNRIAVASKGSLTAAPSVSVFSLTGALLGKVTLEVGIEITSMSVTSNGLIVVGLSTEEIKLYKFLENTVVASSMILIQELSAASLPSNVSVGTNVAFAKSVDIAKNGSKIVVGASSYSRTNSPFEGAIVVYYNYDATYSNWALNLNGTQNYTSSVTSLTLTKGQKTLTVGTNLNYVTNNVVRLTYNAANYMEGSVVDYNKSTGELVIKITTVVSPGLFEPKETITNPFKREGERFGSLVKINLNGDQIAVGASGGQQTSSTTFDNGATTFDLTATEFKETEKAVGSIAVFDLYQDKFIFSDTLDVGDATGTHFGSVISISNKIYVGDYTISGGAVSEITLISGGSNYTAIPRVTIVSPTGYGATAKAVLTNGKITKIILKSKGSNYNFGSTTVVITPAPGDTTGSGAAAKAVLMGGSVHEFSSNNKSWYKFREPSPVVDLRKVKSVFLYDIEQNSVITYLDVVDPLQGKILGIAEQELRFKTHYDPAVYTVGIEELVVDPLTSWKADNVGRLWWDLSATKFLNPTQGSTLYKANTWTKTFNDQSAAVYEWVSSEFMPSQWDSLADTEEGLTLGISGKSKYGDLAYSISQKFDTVSKVFKNIYYFWVKNKTIVPNVEFRKISARDVSDYISSPKNKGISYVTLLGANQFALVNCKDLIAERTVAINFRSWIIDNFEESNIHSHYQLIADGDTGKGINKYIEQKWFDSLIGYDELGNDVPNNRLPAKLKYGVLSKPRQGMFVNRLEALKQFIERVNSVLIKKSIIDDFNSAFTILNSKEEPPSLGSGVYDVAISNFSEIRFIGTNEFVQAVITPVIENGKIIKATIVNAGRGYLNAPNVTINGVGTGATVKTTIGETGQITSAVVEQTGKGYLSTTSFTIRPLTVLVLQDENANNKWSLYSWNKPQKSWFREKTQVYDTTKYWKYADWYATGYNTFTRVDYLVDFAYEIPALNAKVGEIIKVKNQGSGGWILLEKINNTSLLDTTVNFKTIGRQNGTIQFTDNLYKFAVNNIGYDGPTYDANLFDDQPKQELRNILNCIKNNLFVDDLAIEYNALFFASLRYVFSEQHFVDWAFKTSFVKSKHNLGALEQKPTYQTNNLSSYQDYINEVKPYRSAIREFISTYKAYDVTGSQVTDFDLPPRYDADTSLITTFRTSANNSVINYDSELIKTYPYSDWLFNVGNQLLSIEIVDPGAGYVSAPEVIIIGGPSSVTAKAYESSGKVTKIIVNDPYGDTFVTAPTIKIVGSVRDGGHEARAVAILGKGLVRTTTLGMKFDRVSPALTVLDMLVTQTFTGTGSKTRFELTWPVDIIKTNTTVTDNNGEVLGTDYIVYNEIDTASTYKRYKGILQFNTPPSSTSQIVIQYKKNIELLDAADRINHFYKPQPGQLGNDLGQLMQGVDYGGVEVTGVDFRIGTGWDALPWYISGWDTFDTEFTDYLVKSDGTTRTYNLNYVPTDIEYINVYVNDVRIDDPNYDEVTPVATLLATQTAEKAVLEQTLTSLQISYAANFELVADLTVSVNLKDQELTAKEQERDLWPEGSQEYIDLDAEYQVLYQEYLDLNDQLTVANTNLSNDEVGLTTVQSQLTTKTAEIAATQAELDSLPTISNPNAVMNSFKGNGVDTGPINIPASFDLNPNDVIVFRKSTSDGSFKPADVSYDAQVYGGDFTYSSATGLRPEDIVIDGDGFVTPVSSHAPEEVITGQVVDTVDINVYHKVSDGSPVIETRRYITTTDTEDTFAIGQRPSTENGVIVKINNLIVIQDVDYTLDFENQNIVTTNPLPINTEIVVTSMSQNGLNLLDLDYFVGDGSTVEFITVARWNSDYTVFVTVNGQPAEYTTFITDATYKIQDNIAIRFNTAPADKAIINYTVLGSVVDSISKVNKETIVHDGSTQLYPLTVVPEFSQPLENNVLVVSNGQVLRSADTVYFDVVGTSRTFVIDSANYALNTIDTVFVSVAVNGIRKTNAVDYTWLPVSNTLKLKRGVAAVGDKVSITIKLNADYNIVTANTGIVSIELFGNYSSGDIIRVTTFSNHDILNIERYNDYVKANSALTVGTPEYYRINQLTAGRIKLRKPAVAAQYVWVTLNRTLLTPNIDYVLERNLNYIKLKSTDILQSTDILEVIVFSNIPTKPSVGYKIFKDMLNRYSYSRINDKSSTVLAQPLYYYNTQITVEDSSGLPEPSALLNKPGVIFVDGERIEYLVKTGNTLSRLRRGTLGTGVKTLYEMGTPVRDYSLDQTIPYKDEVHTIKTSSNSFTTGSSLYSNSTNVRVSSVKLVSINTVTDEVTVKAEQIAATNGNEILQIIGVGFESNVQVFIGETLCQTNRLSSTELLVTTPATQPGIYDVIIFNPAVDDSTETRVQSSYVASSVFTCLKIALDFLPVASNNASWYRKTIPANYYQANDIEVFVGGKRLRKTSYTVWNPAAGPDSPVGDITLEAEFSVDGINYGTSSNPLAYVRLTALPDPGQSIVVQKRIGKMWTPPGISLMNAESDQSRFIRSTTARLPDSVPAKYYEEIIIPVGPEIPATSIFGDDNTPLLDESGNPLESE